MKTILVAGSKQFDSLQDRKRDIAERFGAVIVKEAGWRLLTGGARGAGSEDGMGGVDYHAAQGAEKVMHDQVKEQEKILTLHPRDDRNDLFKIGSVLLSRAKSTQARRFELISRSDCGVLIEGHKGTMQIVEYSIAAGKPMIPLACTGGASKQLWDAKSYRAELLQLLDIKDPSPDLTMIEKGIDTPEALVETCMKIMRRLLRPSCFVVMPFNLSHSNALWNDMLKPIIEKAGMTAVRADLVHNVGEILEDITKCISEAAVVIVDITGMNPNVMYELGYAHALRKPTILICTIGESKTWEKDLPFDVRGMRILPLNPWDNKEHFLSEVSILLKQIAIS